MPTYEYKCVNCGARRVTATHSSGELIFRQDCPSCGVTSRAKRVFSFAFKPIMHEHFNHTIGRPISDMKQFRSELDRASDEASRTTGIEHRYKPVEWGDAAAVGATNEGIHESNVIRSRNGEPLLPEIKD